MKNFRELAVEIAVADSNSGAMEADTILHGQSSKSHKSRVNIFSCYYV